MSFLSVSRSNICLQAAIEGEEPTDIGPDLSYLFGEQRGRLRDIIASFLDILTSRIGSDSSVGIQHPADEHQASDVATVQLAPPKMQFLREHIKRLLEDGVIEPSSSQYSRPMFMVPKPDQSYRAVADYRLLNQRIEVESVHLLDNYSAFHWFSKARYFTTLDLNQAYQQISLLEASKLLTAFFTDWNLYQYCCVPFGIATGANVLTRLLDMILCYIKFKFVCHYLDDLVIYSDNFDQHLDHALRFCPVFVMQV
jgi:hypothetical protein